MECLIANQLTPDADRLCGSCRGSSEPHNTVPISSSPSPSTPQVIIQSPPIPIPPPNQNYSLPHPQSQLIQSHPSMSSSLSKHSPSILPCLNTTFESQKPQQEPKQQKFSIRKELYQGIKTNDVGKIIARSGSQGKQETVRYDESAEVHNLMTGKRRNYDDHRTRTNNRRREIEELKKEVKELGEVERYWRGVMEASKAGLEGVVGEFEEMRVESEGVVFQKEIYTHILERTKSTFLVEKKRLFDLEFELEKLRVKCSAISNEREVKKNIERQCKRMLTSVEKVVTKQKRGREFKLASLHEIITKKEEAERRRSLREQEISRIAEQTANEKSNEEKEWNKLYCTQRFLHCILKAKINRELLENEKIEKSFQAIKVNTGVGQAEELVEKYLTREETYGSLLNSISDKQPLLEQLQIRNQKLSLELKELREIQSESAQESSLPKPILNQTHSEYSKKQRQLQKLSEKCLTLQKLKQSFYQWSIKFLKKHDAITGQHTKNRLNYFDIYPRNQLDVLYKKIDFLITNALNQPTPNPEHIKFKLLERRVHDTLDEESCLKNMRVRTYEQGEKGAVGDILEEEDPVEYYNEFEYLHENRKNVIKEQRLKKFRVKTKAH